MKEIKDIIIVEFSVKQQAFHRETLEDAIKNNVKNIFLNKSIDYLPIGVFKTHEEADLFIKNVYDKFKKSDTDLQQDAAINFFK